MDVKRNIILSATATAAENTISKVDKQISSIGSGFDKKFSVIADKIGGAFTKIGGTVTKALGAALSVAGTIATTVAAGVVAAFAGLSAFMLKFSGQLTAIESQFDAIFAERKDADAAINELMTKYDYTKSQTQKFLAQMGSKIVNVVGQGQLMKVSKDAVAAAQRISSQFGVSLEQAMDSVAMALQGNVRGLRRYGINIDKILSTTGKMSQIMAQTAKYESAVEATKNTVKWQFDNIKNTFTEKMQQIAQSLDPVLAPLLKTFNDYLSSIDMSWMATASNYLEKFITATKESISSAKPYFDAVVSFFSNLGLKMLNVSSWKEAWAKVQLFAKDLQGVINQLREDFKSFISSLQYLVQRIEEISTYLWNETLQTMKTTDALQTTSKTFALLGQAFNVVAGVTAIVVQSGLYFIDALKQMWMTLKLVGMQMTGGKFVWKDKFTQLEQELEKERAKSDEAFDKLYNWTENSVKKFGEIWNTDYSQKFNVDPQIKDATDKADKAGQKVVDAIADGANKAAEDAADRASKIDFNWIDNFELTDDVLKQLTGGLIESKRVIFDFGTSTNEFAKNIDKLATSANESVDRVKNNIGKDVNVQLDDAVHKLQTNDYSSILVEARDVIFTAITGLGNMFTEQVNEQKRTNDYLQNGVSLLKDISSNLTGVDAFA